MEEDEISKMMRHSVEALRKEVVRLNEVIDNQMTIIKTKEKTISNLKKKSK
jgi:hypothetical protein